MENHYYVITIGSGPGGYVSAIRCAQLGMLTAIIERYPTLGGTCLNVGCIPSKALLDSSEHFYKANCHFEEHGIMAEKIKLNWPRMPHSNDEVVGKVDLEKAVSAIARPDKELQEGSRYK